MTEVEAARAPDSGIAHEVHGPQTGAEHKIECDNEYYFQEDPMAIFLVENCLFRIHRHYLLEGSEVFRDMFASPAEGSGPEGTNNERPISLPEVTKGEFKALLDYFYLPPHSQRHSKGSGEENLQIHIDLLSISHRYLFDKIFQYAMGKLQPLMPSVSATRRFIVGQKYGVNEWVISAYESLLDSEAAPTAQELEILGFDKAARLMKARDAMHRRHLQVITALCKCTRHVEVTSIDPYSKLTKRETRPVSLMTQVVKPASKTFIPQFFES